MDSGVLAFDLFGVVQGDTVDHFAVPAVFAVFQAKAGAGEEVFLGAGGAEVVVGDAVVQEEEAAPGLVILAQGEAVFPPQGPAFIAREEPFFEAANAGHAA